MRPFIWGAFCFAIRQSYNSKVIFLISRGENSISEAVTAIILPSSSSW